MLEFLGPAAPIVILALIIGPLGMYYALKESKVDKDKKS